MELYEKTIIFTMKELKKNFINFMVIFRFLLCLMGHGRYIK